LLGTNGERYFSSTGQNRLNQGWLDDSHDPFLISISEAIKRQIDLAAESAIAAERDSEKIAVETKVLFRNQI
jgi:hypothetical protein